MGPLTITATSIYLAQALSGLVIALLLRTLQREYPHGYLRQWALSFVAGAIFSFCAALSTLLSLDYAATFPPLMVISTVGSVAGYLQICWLVFGTFELATRRPVRRKFVGRLVSVAVVGGAVAPILWSALASEAATEAYNLHVGFRSTLAAIACVFAGRQVWRSRAGKRNVGFVLVSNAFFAYALIQLNYVLLWAMSILTATPVEMPLYLGFLDFLVLSFIGLGMIASLLEDEHEASATASREFAHLAYHDPVTGLPNRTLFIDHLLGSMSNADETNSGIAIVFLDLDRFKEINDSLGHSVGDNVIRSVAERVRGLVAQGDVVARFGGDEFALVLHNVNGPEHASGVAQRILESVRLPHAIHGRELFVTTSIGITLYPGDGDDPETLVRNADTAMYRAKEQGRDNIQLYAPAMNARALERLALEQMLRRALANNELQLHYQPLVDLRTRKMYGTEALIRWQHPELGLLGPGHFIPIAELSGFIVPIGKWVLETACRQTKLWQEKRGEDFLVSVNLSARQFQQADLVQEVEQAITRSGLPPHALTLEITESNAMQNAESSILTLRELKKLGVRISMDDFGTGYSSLSYLKRFPIDTLKLDQSFVRDLPSDEDDSAIASAIIAMAHSLKLKVVAEGVETVEQLRFLQDRSCDAIQGFFFSRPLNVVDFESFMKTDRELVA